MKTPRYRLVSLLTSLPDLLRRKRQFRRSGPPGRKPSWHVPLTRNNLKIRFSAEITDEQWEWLSSHGWRRARIGPDRRRYRRLSSQIVARLLDSTARESLHDRIVQYDVKRRKRLGIAIEDAMTGEEKFHARILDTIVGAEIHSPTPEGGQK